MKVALKNDSLVVTLSKPELKKLADAVHICHTIAALAPLDEAVKKSAADARKALDALRTACGTEATLL